MIRKLLIVQLLIITQEWEIGEHSSRIMSENYSDSFPKS